MTEKVTLAQLRRMRQMAFERGDLSEVNRLGLSMSMKKGEYPKERRHPKKQIK